jgi:hypothetical protein
MPLDARTRALLNAATRDATLAATHEVNMAVAGGMGLKHAIAPAHADRKPSAILRALIGRLREAWFDGEAVNVSPEPLLAPLEACADAYDRSAWQDIATAPKDGTEILVRCQNRAGLPGTVVAHFASWIEDHPPIDAAFYFWNGGQFTPATKPTHWTPLPAPPVVGCADQPVSEASPLTPERSAKDLLLNESKPRPNKETV